MRTRRFENDRNDLRSFFIKGRTCSVRWQKSTAPAAVQLLHLVSEPKVSPVVEECQKSVKSQQAKSQPVIRHYTPTTTVTLLGTSFTQIPTLESLPSAGRLPVCICNWERITADPWILECVKGYRLELVCPPLQKFPPKVCGTKDQLAIREEVKNLMVKQAIREVEPQKGQFISRLFTVAKKDGSRRPVVNLRPLNNFITKKRFKMEGVVLLKSLVQQGDWMVSIDLKDAYLSVAVAEEHRKYLRFQWERQLYEFLCLPFGLSSAPRTFTKLLKPVMSLIRQQGVRSIVFLDDILLMAGSKERLLRQVQEIVQLLQLLGFVVNFEKSQLNPTQRIQYLGFEIDLVRMRISLPREKVMVKKE